MSSVIASVFTAVAAATRTRATRTARAERQYQLAEPENRLVARTLEARWEEALKREREEEEEYDRFLAQQPATLSPLNEIASERSRRTSRNSGTPRAHR